MRYLYVESSNLILLFKIMAEVLNLKSLEYDVQEYQHMKIFLQKTTL